MREKGKHGTCDWLEGRKERGNNIIIYNFKKPNCIYYHLYHCRYNCVYACGHNVHVWRSEEAFVCSVLSVFLCLGSRNQTLVHRLLLQVSFSVDSSFWTPGRILPFFFQYCRLNAGPQI